MTSSPLLRVSNISLSYRTQAGDLTAVDDVSFMVDAGEALGLVGESGAGKSSLALTLMRLLPRNATLHGGTMEFDGVSSASYDDDAFRREVRWQKIAMVFQGAMESLNPVVKVGNQVMEPLRAHRQMPRREAASEARRYLELVRLPSEVFQRYPHELSGGMKQRVLIAMSLVLQPKLLILDEPTSALDVTIQAQIMDQLKDLKEQLGLAIIFITHDIALASDICDTIGVMYAGRIAELGPAVSILGKPEHPYTQLLLASMPRLHQEGQPQFIPGNPPDMTATLTGCRFQPRCPYAFQRCLLEEPPLITAGPYHQARCWLVEGR